MEDICAQLSGDVVSQDTVRGAFKVLKDACSPTGDVLEPAAVEKVGLMMCQLKNKDKVNEEAGIEMLRCCYIPFIKRHHRKISSALYLELLDMLIHFSNDVLLDLMSLWNQTLSQEPDAKYFSAANFACQRISVTIAHMNAKVSNTDITDSNGLLDASIGRAIGVMGIFKGILATHQYKGEADQKVFTFYSKAILDPHSSMNGAHSTRNEYFTTFIYPEICKLFDGNYESSPVGQHENKRDLLFAPNMIIGLALLSSTQLQVDALNGSGCGIQYINHLDVIITALSHLVGRFCGSVSDSLIVEVINKTVWALNRNKLSIETQNNFNMHEKETVQIDSYLLECCCCETDQSIGLIRANLARSILCAWLKVCGAKDKWNITRSIVLLFGQVTEGNLSNNSIVMSLCDTIKMILLTATDDVALLLLEQIMSMILLNKEVSAVQHSTIYGFSTHRSSNVDFTLKKRRYNTSSSSAALETLILSLPITSLRCRGELFGDQITAIMNSTLASMIGYCTGDSVNGKEEAFERTGYSVGLSVCVLASHTNTCGATPNELNSLTCQDLTTVHFRIIVKFLMNAIVSYEKYMDKLFCSQTEVRMNRDGIFSLRRVRSALKTMWTLSRCLQHQNLPVKRFVSLIQTANTLAKVCKNIADMVAKAGSDKIQDTSMLFSDILLDSCRCSCYIMQLASKIYPKNYFHLAVETYHLLVDTAKVLMESECEYSWKLWVNVLTSLTSFAPSLPVELRPMAKTLLPAECIYLIQARNKSKTASLETRQEVHVPETFDNYPVWKLLCANAGDAKQNIKSEIRRETLLKYANGSERCLNVKGLKIAKRPRIS